MITEPQYWKNEIFKCALYLSEKVDQRRWNSVSVGYLERASMSACYGVRKLFESNYISSCEFNMPIPLRVHPSLGKGITSENWRQMELHYDLTSSVAKDYKFSFLCNQFIHSFVFIPVVKGAADFGLKGIAFNSDRSKKNALYYIDIWDLIDSLARYGGGYVGRPEAYKYCPDRGLVLANNSNSD